MSPGLAPRLVAGALVAAGAACIAVGIASERTRASELITGDDAEAVSVLATPVLSARRVPEFLVQPQAQRRLAAKVAPILAETPKDRCLVVGDGGHELVADHPDLPLPAASNQKLVTAFSAFRTLGPKATLTTRVAATAPVTDGVVNGDLWFIGGGDPIIDSDTYQSTLHYGRTPHTKLEDIADRIRAAGVTRVTGSVKGDDSAFDRVRTVESWPQRYLSQGQVGPLSALSVNDARTYGVIAGQRGPTAQPASDPPGYAATALSQMLAARGITVAGPPGSGKAPASLSEVVSVASMPLSDVVAEMLTHSDNNTAELLVKSLGVKGSGVGSTEAGIAVIRKDLEAEGLLSKDIVVVDGSGLDTGNRVTCRLLSSILEADGADGPLSKGLAPSDGNVGTLADRYRNSPAKGAVRAKTGTLRAVTALSGWVTSSKGAKLRFSFVINTGDRNVQAADIALETRLTEALMSYPEAIDPQTVAPKVQ